LNVKYLLALGLALLAGVAFFLVRNTPSRELLRMQDALLTQKTWHLHAVRNYNGIPPQTDDIDFFCPNFAHQVNQYTDYAGAPAVRESIRYNGASYNLINGRWTKGGAQAEIYECRHTPLADGDGISLPFAAFLGSSSVRRGIVRTVKDGTCRDYEITTPLPYDMLHKEYRFTMCINERDHLPRQTRRDPSISGHEDVVEYSEWGALPEPLLPLGVPR
jgi:hypothetical protein